MGRKITDFFSSGETVNQNRSGVIYLQGTLNSAGTVGEETVKEMILEFMNDTPVKNWDIHVDDETSATAEDGKLVITKTHPTYDWPNS